MYIWLYMYTVGYHHQIWWNMQSYWASDVEPFRYQHWSPFIANKHFEQLCTSSAKKSGQTADLEKYAGHLGRKTWINKNKHTADTTTLIITWLFGNFQPRFHSPLLQCPRDTGDLGHGYCHIRQPHTHSHSLPDLKMFHHDSWYFAAEGTPAAGGIQPLQSI